MTRPWIPVAILAIAATMAHAGDVSIPAAPVYEGQVRSILKAHCFQCHGEEEKPKGALDLRLGRLIIRGGKSGPAVQPGNPDESLLYQRITDEEMPPGEKKLTTAQVEVIGRWIKAGAKTARTEPDGVGPGYLFTDDERNYWAFQPIRRPKAPTVAHLALVQTPIDAFLLARLERDGLSFAPDTDKRTLLRRATFDLTGLPPSPEDVELFLADDAPDAYERLLDRLMTSPRYGERWGRHWLDVAGYADSEGYTVDDPVRRTAYKYRDYVVRSFNADKSFDRFIREQLAGDEMVAPPYKNLDSDTAEKLVATGFLRTAPDGTGGTVDDVPLARNQVIAETLKIVSTSLLGLTVGCAQCHDHRYDAISQVDYYRMRAIFEPAFDPANWRAPQAREIALATDAERRKTAEFDREAGELQRKLKARQQELVEMVLESELRRLPQEVRGPLRAARATRSSNRTPAQEALLKDYPNIDQLNAASLELYISYALPDGKKVRADYDALVAEVAKFQAKKPAIDSIRALTEVPGRVPATHLFHRGDHNQPKQAVSPGDLTVLAPDGSGDLAADDPALPTTGRRLAYARRLTDGKHPLVARVLVNRVWMHHFGRGIVSTPGDFGTQGERPSHPELLDWLADDFMAGGWRMKRLHKLIMLSSAYRQSSRRDPRHDAIDAEDRLYGRFPIRRLEAEAIRDAVLAVAGGLRPEMFGAPVPVSKNEVGEVVVGVERRREFGPSESLGGETRRSLYVQARRSQPPAVLETFDAPLMEPNCESRSSSTVTPQALLMMNSRFVLDKAQRFAERVRREAGDDPRAGVLRAWLLAFTGEPTAPELAAALDFLAEQTAAFRKAGPAGSAGSKGQAPIDPGLRAMATLCQTLLGSNQFLYVD